jgi:serine/threonine-protein kinase
MRYMSPEQLQGKSISARWDVWALGVIAYEALCGTAPFTGTDYATLRGAIIGTAFPMVATLVPEASDKWQDFFVRVFAPLEEQRPQSVEVFWQELKACLG